MDAQFIDFHMHPAIKPLGKSFNRKAGVNSTNRHQQSSIWYARCPVVARQAGQYYHHADQVSAGRFYHARQRRCSHGCGVVVRSGEGFCDDQAGHQIARGYYKQPG